MYFGTPAFSVLYQLIEYYVNSIIKVKWVYLLYMTQLKGWGEEGEHWDGELRLRLKRLQKSEHSDIA